MEVAKVGSYGSIDSVNPEKEVDSLDSIIRQAVGKEPFISFFRSGDSPVQGMQLLHAMDQTGSDKAYSNSKIDYVIRGKEHPVGIYNGLNDEQSKFKESDNFIKDNGAIADGINSTSEQMQIKFPDVFLALAQAAARVNGEPEKYLPGWPLLSSSKAQLQKCKKCSREFCSPINYRRHLRVHRQSLNIKKDSARNREFLGAFWDKLSVDEAKEILSLDDAVIEDVAGSAAIRALSLWVKKQGLSSLPQSYVKAGVTLSDIIQTRTSSLPIPSQELFHVLDDASEKTFLCSGTAISLQKFVFDGETGKMALEMRNIVACVSFLLEQKLVKAWLADKDAEALRCHKLLMEEEEAAQRRQAEILERKRMKKIRQREQKAKEKDKGNEVSSCTSENTYGHLEIPDAIAVSDPYSPEASMSQDHNSLIPCGSYPDGETSHGLRFSSGEAVQETDQQEKKLDNGNLLPVLNHLPPCKQVRTVRNGLYKQTSTTNSVLTKYRNKDNVHMVWTPKAKPENQNQPSHELDQMEKDQLGRTVNSKVLIGSISVTLTKSDGHCPGAVSPLTSSEKEKLLKPETRLKSIEPSLRKQWIPVIHLEDDLRTINSIENMNDRLDESSAAIACHSPDDNCHFASDELSVNDAEVCKDFLMFPRVTDSSASFIFSTTMADTFLFQRWKDVISADHVKLDLIPENDGVDISSSLGGRTMVDKPNIGLTSSRKFDKNCKLEYVPEQRNVYVGR